MKLRHGSVQGRAYLEALSKQHLQGRAPTRDPCDETQPNTAWCRFLNVNINPMNTDLLRWVCQCNEVSPRMSAAAFLHANVQSQIVKWESGGNNYNKTIPMVCGGRNKRCFVPRCFCRLVYWFSFYYYCSAVTSL